MTNVYLSCKCGNIVLVPLDHIPKEQWLQPQEHIMNKYKLAYCDRCS